MEQSGQPPLAPLAPINADPYKGLTKIYAIKDRKAETFHRPFYETTDGCAIRALTTAVNTETAYAVHPDDYSLWRIGHWDEEKGIIVSQPAPEHLIECAQLTAEAPDN